MDPPSEPYPPFDRPEEIAPIWVAAWNRRDAARLADLFDEDAEFVNVVGLWWHSRAAIYRAHEYGLRVIFNESTLRLVHSRVRWLSEEVAVVHAKMALRGQTAVAGVGAPGERRTIFSFVVHRTAGGWRCASAQNTDVVPGSETHVLDESGQLRAVDYREGPG